MARETEQRRQTTFSWGALAAAVVIAGGLVFGAAVQNRQQELARVTRDLTELRSAARVVASPPKKLKDTAAAIEEKLETRVPTAQMLSVLSQTLPEGSWLSELTYNADTGCVVRGYSLTPDGAQRAQIAILQQGIFDEVTLDYRTEDRVNNVPVWAFQVSCKLRPEERRRGATRR